MYAEEMYRLGTNRSVIRDLFEYGNKRKAQIGAENVFDFSLGNPNVPAPESVKEVLADLDQKEDPVALHSYYICPGRCQSAPGHCRVCKRTAWNKPDSG